MSDRQKENALRIAAYLGNRLSPEDREAFKRELSENDELRLQYVDGLMNKAGSGVESGEGAIGGREEVAGFEEVKGVGEVRGDEEVKEAEASRTVEEVREAESVRSGEELRGAEDAGVEGVAYETGEAEWPEEGRKAGGFLGSGLMVWVAAVLLIVAGVVIYMLVKHQEFWDKAVAGAAVDSGHVDKQQGHDSAMKVAADSGAAGKDAGVAAAGTGGKGAGAGVTVAGGNGVLADSIYERLYKPYMRGDDPGEVRVYYKDYKSGKYAAVLAAGDSSVKGVGQRALLVRDYMRLYVGLSYLATGDAKDAVTELEGVVLRTKPKDQLYEVARWYLALAWVRRGDADPVEARSKALGLARDISHSYSRYSEPSKVLIRALKSSEH